jgi:clathrin heavy chain
MQLYSFEQKKSQPLEAHAAAFATVKVSVEKLKTVVFGVLCYCISDKQSVLQA